MTDYNASGYPEKYSEKCVAEAWERMEDVRSQYSGLDHATRPCFACMLAVERILAFKGSQAPFFPKVSTQNPVLRSLMIYPVVLFDKPMLPSVPQSRKCPCGTNSQECYDPLFGENFCYPKADFWPLGYAWLHDVLWCAPKISLKHDKHVSHVALRHKDIKHVVSWP